MHCFVQVGDNGVISFTSPFTLFNPEPFPGFSNIHVVAPYWSDNDIRRQGSVIYEVFQFGDSTIGDSDSLLDTVSDFITENFNNDSEPAFKGTYMILAEWREVHPFPDGDSPNTLSPAQKDFVALVCIYHGPVVVVHTQDLIKHSNRTHTLKLRTPPNPYFKIA